VSNGDQEEDCLRARTERFQMYPYSFRIDVYDRQEVFPMYSSEAVGHRNAGVGFSGLTSVTQQES
jgi:hypothetical protein